MEKIRILVVDDSILFRHFLCEIFNREPDLTVVGTAADAQEAAQKIVTLSPDLLTLDIEMPGMNGIAFLGRLMTSNPLPVVMVSSYTEENSSYTIEALSLGAVDFALKPINGDQRDKESFARELVQKIRTAARASVRPLNRNRQEQPNLQIDQTETDIRVIAIGASTGGTRAVYEVLRVLPDGIPPVIIVQHMPGSFTRRYANRMNELCLLDVREAQDRDEIRPGRVLIAPGDRHLVLEENNGVCRVRLKDDPPINYYKPSIDVFFQSVADVLPSAAIGVILTGMGSDGARGLLALKESGAFTLAQDKETSLIFSMPRAAWEIGAPYEMLPIEKIPARIMDRLNKKAL